MPNNLKRFTFLLAGFVLVLAALAVMAYNQRQAQGLAKAIESEDQVAPPTDAVVKGLTDYAQIHMGVNVKYTLTGSYNRAVESTKAAVAAASAANSQIYADAQKACSGKTDSITQARCNQAYLDSHLQSLTSPNLTAPQVSSFTRTVKSPAFALDLAGALLAGAALSIVYGLYTLVIQRRRR